ncbi:caspase family protein, partial [Candidatus Bipolaricaulota bacterium]|nr:caspase family protein [Candidatus Bipolaricaulota bacterium]
MKANLQATRSVLLVGLGITALLLGGCMWLFNTDPIARFTATPGTGAAPLDVWLDASSSSDPDTTDVLTYAWDFGDGTHGVGMTLSHRFSSPGTYRVELTVDDDWGGVADAYLDVSVTEQTGTYYAIVVGIADYYQNPLQYTDDDAMDFANLLLQSPNMWEAGNIILLLNRDATTTNFVAALNAISAQATANDMLVIFYSGHGNQWADMAPFDEVDGFDESLCFIDYDMTDDWLASLLSTVPVGQLLVLVDACFSGGMIRAASEDGASPQAVGIGFGEDLVREASDVAKDLNALNRSVVVISASADYEYSIEWPDFKNGVFTYYLLNAMTGPADIYGNHDGLISAEECYNYLAPNVVNFTTNIGQVHHPQMLDHFIGELVFAE